MWRGGPKNFEATIEYDAWWEGHKLDLLIDPNQQTFLVQIGVGPPDQGRGWGGDEGWRGGRGNYVGYGGGKGIG